MTVEILCGDWNIFNLLPKHRDRNDDLNRSSHNQEWRDEPSLLRVILRDVAGGTAWKVRYRLPSSNGSNKQTTARSRGLRCICRVLEAFGRETRREEALGRNYVLLRQVSAQRTRFNGCLTYLDKEGNGTANGDDRPERFECYELIGLPV